MCKKTVLFVCALGCMSRFVSEASFSPETQCVVAEHEQQGQQILPIGDKMISFPWMPGLSNINNIWHPVEPKISPEPVVLPPAPNSVIFGPRGVFPNKDDFVQQGILYEEGANPHSLRGEKALSFPWIPGLNKTSYMWRSGGQNPAEDFALPPINLCQKERKKQGE